MPNGTSGVTSDGRVDQAQLEKNRRLDLDNQVALMELQRKTNAQNTTMTAISTLYKGNDDVLRAIANNLK